jgi:hypothetical protein
MSMILFCSLKIILFAGKFRNNNDKNRIKVKG